MYTSFEEAGESELQEAMEAGGYMLLGAWHDPDAGYEDALYALLRKDGVLFEYEDSHCSCQGFEFNPQPITLAYLKARPCPESVRGVVPAEFEALVQHVSRFHVE